VTLSMGGPQPATCSIFFTYPDSSTKSLPAQTGHSGGAGYQWSWTWTVPASMPAGTAHGEMTCTYPGYTFPPDMIWDIGIIQP
jgi:hypothetical protein